MAKEDKNVNNLKVLLSAMQDDHLGKGDFTKAFKEVIDFIKRMEKKNLEDVKFMSTTLNKASELVKNTTAGDFENLSNQTNTLIGKNLETIKKTLDDKIESIDMFLSQVKDGKDADEDRVADLVVSKFKIPTIEELKDDLPKLGGGIRDALEILNDEDRLDVSAIRGLEELLKKNKSLGGGGGFSYMSMDRHFVDDTTPVGTVNGVNKVFTLPKVANPAESLKVFVNGQRMKAGGGDYTLSGVTITFVNAPLTGSILTADLRF